MADFQVGDVVRLNSDGPWMTVTAVGRDGNIYCTWFPERADVKAFHFPPQALRKKVEGEK